MRESGGFDMKEIWKKYRKSIFVVSCLLILCNVFSTLHPYVLKRALDIDFARNDIEVILLKFIVIYIAIHVILRLLKNTREIVINKVI